MRAASRQSRNICTTRPHTSVGQRDNYCGKMGVCNNTEYMPLFELARPGANRGVVHCAATSTANGERTTSRPRDASCVNTGPPHRALGNSSSPESEQPSACCPAVEGVVVAYGGNDITAVY